MAKGPRESKETNYDLRTEKYERPLPHATILYFFLFVSMLLAASCLVSLHRLSQRQTTLERDLSLRDGKGCCSCCSSNRQVNELHQGHSGQEKELAEEEDSRPVSESFGSSRGETKSFISRVKDLVVSAHRRHPQAETNRENTETLNDVFNRARRSLDGSEHSGDERISSIEVELEDERFSESQPAPTTEGFSPTTGNSRNRNLVARSVTIDAQTTRQSKQKGRSQRNKSRAKPDVEDQQTAEKKKRLAGTTTTELQQRNVAIHLHAREDTERLYESGPAISLNGTSDRDTVYRFWKKANWVDDSVDDVLYLDETTGHVTVEVEGVYMIYAQVVYHDLSGRWSYGVYVGDRQKVKCLVTEQLRDLRSYHPTSHGVYQSCYTSIVLHVRKNQGISIRCLYGSRTILTQPEFTFWGIVRIS